MFLPVAFNPNLDHIRYHVETNKPSTANNPYTQDMLRTGRLSFENYLDVIPDPAFGRDVEPDYTPEPNNPSPKPYKSSAHGLSRAKVAAVDYLNAELAKHYGMSKSTAYQEALSNTSYQRAVKDMQAAGLNPSVMFGSGRAQGASSSVYASEVRSGGGYSRRRGSGSSGNGKLFDSGIYYGISTAIGLATAVMTKNPANYWIGSAGAQGVMGALNAAWKK